MWHSARHIKLRNTNTICSFIITIFCSFFHTRSHDNITTKAAKCAPIVRSFVLYTIHSILPNLVHILHGTAEHTILPIVCLLLLSFAIVVSVVVAVVVVSYCAVPVQPSSLCVVSGFYCSIYLWRQKKSATLCIHKHINWLKSWAASESQVFCIYDSDVRELAGFFYSLCCVLSRNTGQVFQPNNARCWTTIKQHNECKRTPANNLNSVWALLKCA